MVPSPLLLSAIEIEGYAVLAVELLATRQLTPYGGNATDIVAIVIVADLLPWHSTIYMRDWKRKVAFGSSSAHPLPFRSVRFGGETCRQV